MKKAVKRIVQILLGLYVIVCLLMFFFQEKMIFFPEKLTADHEFSFSETFEEVYIEAEDGILLNGLLFEADSSKGLVFYLHGNGGSLNSWGTAAKTYTDLNYDLFMLDYRSYGKSGGKIKGQRQLFSDIQAAYDEMNSRYPENKTVLLGYSLGTGLVTKLASENDPKMLILQAPYFSIADIVQSSYPFIPIPLLKYKMRTNRYIQDCNMPIVLFHGDADEMIPIDASVRLHALVPDNSTLITLKDQGHHGMTGNPEYVMELSELLK